MPEYITVTLIVVIIAALVFDFINGFHDTANAIATSVSTRVLTPRWAIIIAATLNFAGAMWSTKVAKTISGGLVYGKLDQYVIIAALLAAIIWNLITWYFGIPSSSSHALIGGLVGSSIVFAMSLDKIMWGGILQKVIIPLVSSPILGFLIGFGIMKLLFQLLASYSYSGVNKVFSKLQIVSAMFMAWSHGNNDAQKSMGIITLALISAGAIAPGANVPNWVKIACAIAMAIGTSVGGWKIIKTMGVNMITLQPIGGFAAETAAALVIETASHFGAPVSTTHVISTAIMGVGSAKRLNAVKWALARNIVYAWILTIPVTMAIGALITALLRLLY